MAAVRGWLCSIVVVSLLLSAMRTLTPEGALRRVCGFTGGLVLMAAVLKPFAGNRFELPAWDGERYAAEIQAERSELERRSREALSREVSERTAALIEERTGIPAAVEVREADGVPLPWSVTLYGTRAGDAAAWIAAELGIPEARQTWRAEEEKQGS